MEHTVIFKRDGLHAGHARLDQLPDGRLAAGIPLRTVPPGETRVQHPRIDDWLVLESSDEGKTWDETDDPTIPFSWPGKTPREKLGRFATITSDGSYLCTGATGIEMWPAERRNEAEEQGRAVREPIQEADRGVIAVGGNTVFVQRSTDKGRTWDRQDWTVPGMTNLAPHPRYPNGGRLADGTYLISMNDVSYFEDSSTWRNYAWRSTDEGRSWSLHPMGTHATGMKTNETTVMEVSPGRVLALLRTERDPRYLLERWSYDGGITWSEALRTSIWGYPVDLTKLRDGRILCSLSYRREPMGIRAVLSNDGGVTWDTDNTVILRDDGVGDLGYPGSVQLPDGSILTVYYITLADGVTHSAATRWEV